MECGQYKYRIEPQEVDLTSRSTIISIGDHILHTAGEDADKYGFGIRNLNQKNSSWVLSRVAIEMDRYPKEYEHFTIETWVNDVGKLLTTRNFILRDDSDCQIGAAVTNWAMIDLDTRLPLDLLKNIECAEAIVERPSPIMKPAKIRAVTSIEPVEIRKVRYSDIDFNQHTNTMRYIQWMIETLPLERLISGHLSRLDINFMHETRYGEDIHIFSDLDDNSSRNHFELRRCYQTVCRAIIEWK